MLVFIQCVLLKYPSSKTKPSPLSSKAIMRLLITILRVTDNIKTYLSALKLISNIYEGTNHRTRIQHWGVLLRDFFIEDFFMNTGKNILQNIFCKTEWDTTMQFLVDNFFYLCSAKMVNQFFHAIHSRTASPLLLERFFFWRLTSSFSMQFECITDFSIYRLHSWPCPPIAPSIPFHF